jgi:fermentation-respiration switch protein FrsA (DUF1100 family)
MLATIDSKSGKTKENKRWIIKVTKSNLVVLFAFYVALSPVFGMGLYNHLLFFPARESYDLTEIFAKIQSATHSKKTDVIISSGKEKLNGWLFRKSDAKKIILVSHGNGGEIAHRLLLVSPMLYANASVLLYDYEGYGRSTGQPSVAALKQDGLAAYDYVHNELHYAPEDIIVYGESLGSGVTTYIAENRKVAAIIIQSGFSSLTSAAKDRLFWLNFYLPIAFAAIEMDNVAYLRGSHPPLLLMHGDKDVVLPIKNGYKMLAEAREPKKFVKFDGCGHNDICVSRLYAPCIAQFISSLPSTAPESSVQPGKI